MADLIDRQAAIDAFDCSISGVPFESAIYVSEYADKMMSRIKALPSAQPEITLESAIDYLHSIGWMQAHDMVLTERKTGRWKKAYGDHIYAGLRPWAMCCSECGMIGGGTRYCPNCGADMRGETDG